MKSGIERGYCSRCSKFYPLDKLIEKNGVYFCRRHGCQVRRKAFIVVKKKDD